MKRHRHILQKSLFIVLTGWLVTLSNCKEEEQEAGFVLVGYWQATSIEATDCDNPNDEFVDSNPGLYQEITINGTYSIYQGTLEFGGQIIAIDNTLVYRERTVEYEVSEDGNTFITIYEDPITGCTEVTTWVRIDAINNP